MILSKRLILKSDNSVFGDFGRKNIIISDRPFQPSNLSGAENIVEGFDNLTDVIKTYGSIENYITNLHDREMDYTLLCNPSSYAAIFSSFLKSYYGNIATDSAYAWYVLNTQYDNLLTYQLNQQFKLQGLEGFTQLCPFDLYINEPLEEETFSSIFSQSTPISIWQNSPYTSLGLEHHLLLYGSDKEKAFYTPTIVRKRVLQYIVNTLLLLRKDILLYLYPYEFKESWSCKIHEIDYLKENKIYGSIFDEEFSVKNITYITETYSSKDLINLLITIKEKLGQQISLDKKLLDIIEREEDHELMDFICENPKYLIVDNHYVYKTNPLWIYRIVHELNQNNTQFFVPFTLSR